MGVEAVKSPGSWQRHWIVLAAASLAVPTMAALPAWAAKLSAFVEEQSALAGPAASSLLAAGFRLQAGQGQLQLLENASGMPLRRWALQDRQGHHAAGVVALLHSQQRRSFIVVLAGLSELWEISHDPAAEPVFAGLVHDYRMGEGLAEPGYLALRRTPLDLPLRAAQLVEGQPWLVAQQGADAVLIHLDARRLIARVPAADALSARLQFTPDGVRVLVFGEGPRLQRLDTRRWLLLEP